MPADPTPVPSLMLRALWAAKPARQTQREADYVESMLEVDALHRETRGGARLLDVPCGNGRIAHALAARGHHVSGIDIAPAAVERAQIDAQSGDLRGTLAFQVGDMRVLPWDNEFDGAYCLWESFGYFDDAGNRAFMDAVARTLKPGARFVLDTHILETLLPNLGRRDWTRVDDDLLMLEERSYDPHTSTVTRHWQAIAEGRIERSTLAIRIYSYRELVALLESAGFTDCTGYSWMSIVPFMLGAPRLVMVATRA